jgi:hypothetical protein
MSGEPFGETAQRRKRLEAECCLPDAVELTIRVRLQ